jgi:hypothetical protein
VELIGMKLERSVLLVCTTIDKTKRNNIVIFHNSNHITTTICGLTTFVFFLSIQKLNPFIFHAKYGVSIFRYFVIKIIHSYHYLIFKRTIFG